MVSTAGAAPVGAAMVVPGDPGYDGRSARSVNARFRPRPRAFVLARSVDDVVEAVQEAHDTGRVIVARSGGHCFEDFVSHPGVDVVVDLAAIDDVAFDQARGSVVVGAGAPMLSVHRTTVQRWGTVLPAGACSTVAAGGHVAVGGYGPLSRRAGLVVDHLEAVEVVVVGEDGRARALVAGRDPADPHHDLWWAHTGGGAGEVGIVTRYWMRSPGTGGGDPRRLLPRAPEHALLGARYFPRESVDRTALHRLVAEHGRWHERHSAPDDERAGVFAGLVLPARLRAGDEGLAAMLFVQVDSHTPRAERVLAESLEEMTGGLAGIEAPVVREPWLDRVAAISAISEESGRLKVKSGYCRRAWTDEQVATALAHLDRTEHPCSRASLTLQGTGGAVNAVAPGDTAVAQRDSVLRAVFLGTWQEARDDAEALAWIRHAYRDVYAATGGVPVPDDAHDGCYLGYADADVADPEWNTSGVDWRRLYHGDGADRLGAVARRHDPAGLFGRHRLSIRSPR